MEELGSSGTISKFLFERVFFIVDRTRLKDEKDELKNAIVVYIPEKDLAKSSLEQRCSQLVGIALLVNYFTGELPKFIRLKSNGFATRRLGENFIMGLQSKFDEPKWCVLQLIDRIHDFFCFYYSSPISVWTTAQQDWEIFTAQMSAIFNCILEFTLREGRSLPSMFNPLPYTMLNPNKGGTQLYIKAQRLLRQCQQNESIIAGCMFYDGEILCSQLPPDMMEKLLLVASGGIELNSRSILEDQLAPESVWIINVYLTTEQLELTRHLRRRTRGLKLMYDHDLQSNPNLESQIQSQQRRHNAHTDLSSGGNRQYRRQEDRGMGVGVTRHETVPVSRTGNTNDPESFVTISYGSDSVSFTKKTSVNPLKRTKVHGKRSLSGQYSDDDVPPSNHRGIFDPLPPLPPKPQPPEDMPPILPRRVLNVEESLPPIPSRTRQSSLSVPKPPPRRGDQPPVPPPRSPRASYKVSNDPPSETPPSPPPRVKSDIKISPHGKEERPSENGGMDDSDVPVSPVMEYGTPKSSLDASLRGDISSEGLKEDGSDQSEGYQTPPPFSKDATNGLPLSSQSYNSFFSLPSRENSIVAIEGENPLIDNDDTLKSNNHTSESTPIAANNHAHSSPIKADISGPARNHFEDDLENHYEFDDEPVLDQPNRKKNISVSSIRSDVSGDSLVITKAVSEYNSSQGSPTLESNMSEAATSLFNNKLPGTQLSFEASIQTSILEESLRPDDPSPTFEQMESASEGDDELGGLHEKRFAPTLRQQGVDTKLGTLANQSSKRRPKLSSNPEDDQPSNDVAMHRKCLYVQKCVNTVVAVLADDDLSNNTDLIRNLWTTLLSWVVPLNNTVEPSLKDQDSIYYPMEGSRPVGGSSFKAYHAGFSANIAMCEVSSITAPYQFRHAVRRVHQEYAQNPSLKQVSLCKDLSFKMISQNVLGREVFYHSNRVGTSDALLAHSYIERQVKQKHNYVTEGFTTDFL